MKGTTWVREILWQIYNGGSRSDENIRKRVFYLEATPLLPGESPGSLLPVMDLLPSPRLMFSHLPYHLIPGGKDDNSACKYIYLARNPKDVVVSLYHFLLSTRQLSGEDATALTWETFVDLFLQGKRECLARQHGRVEVTSLSGQGVRLRIRRSQLRNPLFRGSKIGFSNPASRHGH